MIEDLAQDNNGLTAQQKNIWNLQKYYEGASVSNICGVILYDDIRNPDRLESSIRQVIDNQTALRLRFSNTNPVKQYLSDEKISIETIHFDNDFEMSVFADKMAKEPMRIVDSPMCSFVVFESEKHSGIIAKMNHLIADAWSFGLLAEQVEALYSRNSESEECGDQEIHVDTAGQKGDYLSYVRDDQQYRSSEKYKKDRRFWEEKYSRKPEKCGVKYTNSFHPQNINARRIHKKLSAELSKDIKTFCLRHNISEAVLFEGAVLLYLHIVNTENETSTIGVPVLNRNKLKEKYTLGMFVSTMPLVVDLDTVETVGELLEKISVTKRKLFRHQRLPYEEIQQIVRKKHGFTESLFDVMVSIQSSQLNRKHQFQTKWYSNGYCDVPYLISIDQRDSEDIFYLTLDYQIALFPEEAEAEAVWERIEGIIAQIVDKSKASDIPISEIDILPDKEKNILINQFNNTYVPYPENKCIHEMFAEQVRKTPERVALVFEGQEFTYRQLDEMSNSLAKHLRTIGVGRNEIVPIISERNWRIIIAMLAVLKAGGAYMPVSPDYPLERIETMLEIAESRFVLSYGYDEELSVKKIGLKDFDFGSSPEPIDCINTSDDLCYIIFTSGSTGKPKGVIISHKNFINTICWRRVNYGYSHKTNVDISPITTDTFSEDIITALLSGEKLLLICDRTNISVIEKEIQRCRDYFSLMTTPSFFSSIFSTCKDLDWDEIILVGEQLSTNNKELFYRKVKKIHNEYGPSECTVCATYKTINKNDSIITIGRPIANTQIYILDKHQNLLPIGVAGELCIAGAGVGKGYLNQPELTKERFIPNPFATDENGHGKVLYRTGDLACWRADGEIEYLGRIDTQVKIRGLRIELGEIESAMTQAEGVGLVAAAARKDKTGRQYLVGYYTSETEIDEKEMRSQLSNILPRYMVPNYFMRLDEMPMTASGKIDRKNLPMFDVAMTEREYVAPETKIEATLCEIMAKVLSVDRFGVNDNFFDLGGDSLGAMTVVALAHERGIEIGLQKLFDCQDIRSLAVQIGENREVDVSEDKKDYSFDSEKYNELLQVNCNDESDILKMRNIGNVLLTGVTGFLGAHILDALMKDTEGKIYCLVRKGNVDDQGRLREILKYYFGEKYLADIDKRIIPVAGNIEKDNLSDELPEDVQTVIHAAANVKHFGPYDDFHKVNVEGTRHVAEYAQNAGAELIHISTISVSGSQVLQSEGACYSETETLFDESCFYVGQPLDNVYIQSKFEAERVVMDEIMDNRLQAKIIRVGNLTNRASDYRFQPNYESNAFLKRLKAILEIGLFPDYLIPLYSEFSPVDITAEGIVKIAGYSGIRNLFHLYSNKPLAHRLLLEILESNGISIRIVSGEKFYKEVEETLSSKEKEYIFKSLRNEMDSSGRLILDNNIHITNEATTYFMSKLGFEWNDIDEEYIKGYLDYFRKAGFFNV